MLDVEQENGLHPAFLIASAMSGDGHLDLELPMPRGMTEAVRVEFSLGPIGEVLQRPYVTGPTGRRPLSVPERRQTVDWVTLAECLEQAFGKLTPEIFRLDGSFPRGDRPFIHQGAAAARERLRLVHAAFNLYLMAYEAYAS